MPNYPDNFTSTLVAFGVTPFYGGDPKFTSAGSELTLTNGLISHRGVVLLMYQYSTLIEPWYSLLVPQIVVSMSLSSSQE